MMDKTPQLIALILFFYGTTSFKFVWLRKALGLKWGLFLIEAIAAFAASFIIVISMFL